MLSLFSKYKTKTVQGYKILLRKKSVDEEVFDYVFKEKYHHPHLLLTTHTPLILDLGTNIGLTVVDYKILYPDSIIYAYEMDHDNFELAQKNCASFQNVFLYNKAVWFENTKFNYRKSANADAYKLEKIEKKGCDDVIEVTTVSISSIISENNIKWIDYVKLDVEGAEYEIFQNDLSWLDHVAQIKIEVHYGEDILGFIIKKLIEHDFITEKDTHHWSTIIAWRK